MNKLFKQYSIIGIICSNFIMASCTYSIPKDIVEEDITKDVESIDNKYEDQYEEYQKSLNMKISEEINTIQDNYNYNLDFSVLVLDIQNNELISSYGDIDKYIVSDNIFKPISTAILFNEYGITRNDIIESEPYKLQEGHVVVSVKEPTILKENYTFEQGFIDMNNSIFFHALDGKDLDKFYNKLNQLNLNELDIRYDNGADIVSNEVLGYNLNISQRELALIYSSFFNGGKLYNDIGNSNYIEVFDNDTGFEMLILLNEALSQWNSEYNLLEYVENIKYDISGMYSFMSTTQDFDEYTLWFAGAYPTQNPQFMTILNVSFENTIESNDNMIKTKNILPAIHNIINYSVDNYVR